ncbi:Gfo/Idh/MocA family protein, partial [Burkholderia ubonensis]
MKDLESRAVRFGIVGAGSIARRFAQSLAHVPGAALAGVWARRADAAAAFCATHGGTPAASLDALLASDVDAIYIATLHDSHAEYALASLAAGKAVLCEKPATLNAAQLETVLRAARDAGRLFMEAMKPPFFPLYLKLRAHLRDDPIGEIRLVRAGCASSSVPGDHPVYRLEQAGGALLDIGIYETFLAVDWLGAPLDVQTLGRVGATG